MRIGLIARGEKDRGLGVQSRNFANAMNPASVLHVVPENENPGQAYANETVVDYKPKDHSLPEAAARGWLEGLDVVFAAETPYDWRLIDWAREMGVKTVIQGNPEFYRHHLSSHAHLSQPDQWWWPTSWRLGSLPAGPVMPCPMEDGTFPSAADPAVGPLRIVHVMGKRAFADRNGTEILAQALRRLANHPVVATIYGLDGELPDFRGMRNVEFNLHPDGAVDRWEMYENQHLLVLPRRYGGNCLPALEAASKGLAVMMPDTSPNFELASVLVPPRRTQPLQLACGPVRSAETNSMDLIETISRLAEDRGDLAAAMERSAANVPRWSEWRQRYLDQFAEVVG